VIGRQFAWRGLELGWTKGGGQRPLARGFFSVEVFLDLKFEKLLLPTILLLLLILIIVVGSD
jgi:hypothetical protein